MILRSADPHHLNEPGLDTIKRQVKSELDKILGDGELRADQGARILGLMAEAAARFGREQNLDVRLDSAFGAGASARFARADGNLDNSRQERLFSDLPTPEGERVANYSLGFCGGAAGLGEHTRSLPQRTAPERSQPAADFLARLLVGVAPGRVQTLHVIEGSGDQVSEASGAGFESRLRTEMEAAPL